jgi:hypothetical protein
LSSLIRATDEVYSVCEMEENELQCREVIGLLETALADFRELISRFELHSQFEATRPQALAWSVRKISPMHTVRLSAGTPSRGSTPLGTPSYADRVKGSRRAVRKDPSHGGEDTSRAASAARATAERALLAAASLAQAAPGPFDAVPATIRAAPDKQRVDDNGHDMGELSDPEEDVIGPAHEPARTASAQQGEVEGRVATPTTPTLEMANTPDPPLSDPASDPPSETAASPEPPIDGYIRSNGCDVPVGVLWSDLANDAGWSSDGSDDDMGSISAASPGSTVRRKPVPPYAFFSQRTTS